MDNKVGIITFHNAINYGGILQTVALHKFLENLGIKNEIIDYQNDLFLRQYDPIQMTGNIVKDIIRRIIITPNLKRKNRRFREFLLNNCKVSPAYSKAELQNGAELYDGVITGSDQVFNINLTEGDTTYFLDFVNSKTKAISYAASFGQSTFTENQSKTISKHLMLFDALSIRENKGVILAQELCNKEIEQHIDPTMLLSEAEWRGIAKMPEKSHYVLLYTLGKGNDVINVINKAKELAKLKNRELIYINDKIISFDTRIHYRKYVSPEEFVGLFANADYVVTNSFHGTAFSIIFQKQFYVDTNLPNGKGSRILSLLDLLGIRNRDITVISSNIIDSKFDIDWESVLGRIVNERKRAMKYLSKAVIGNENACNITK